MSSDEREHNEKLEISPDSAHDDINYEAEEELEGAAALQLKLKKLRGELAEAQKQKAEYLEGWQRAKAEMINIQREAQESARRAGALACESFVEDLIPAIDSFDMAMAGDGWKAVDSAWRTGVESIRNQILSVLQSHGIETFGAEGDKYDPNLHETVQEVHGGPEHTVASVLRRGYRSRERILRPAHVSVYTERKPES